MVADDAGRYTVPPKVRYSVSLEYDKVWSSLVVEPSTSVVIKPELFVS